MEYGGSGMKKRWIPLILSLVLYLAPAAPAAAAEASPGQAAYTSDRLLWAGPIPLAGLVTINQEYYLPLELLKETGKVDSYIPLAASLSSGEYHIRLQDRRRGETLNVIKPVVYATPGLELGPVTPAAIPVKVQDPRTSPQQAVTLPAGSVYQLAGYYTMVRLRTLGEYYGYREDTDGVHICEEPSGETPAAVWEEDLAGKAAKSLRSTDTKATLQAFHNYLVNNLTHSDFMDNAYFQKNDPQRHERAAQMSETYRCQNNFTLASRYGVCQNYAELFQAMCLQNCTPCELVGSNEMDHVWNRVWLWGEWYHVDVTFDDPGPKPALRQTYFLVTPEKMMQTHCWEGPDFTMPSEYDPAWTQIDPMNLPSAAQYRKCLAAQLVQGKTKFSLRPAVAAAFGGSRGPVTWAHAHYGVPAWELRWSYQYNAAKKTYDYTVIYP